MSKAASFANDVLDHYLQNGSSGSITVGSATYALPMRVRFTSTVSTDTTAGTEWTGGSYPAGGVSLAGALATAAASKSKANTAAVTVTNAPATTWADNEIVDSTGTPKRVVFRGGTSIGKTVNSGDTCTIPIGSLTATEA